EFVCYESTECHGAVVETDLPLRGDCCGGRGLSFSLSGDTCRNCFSMEEFCNDGSEFYVAFFSNVEVAPLFSQASIFVKIDNMEDFQQTVAYSFKSETKEREIGPRSSVELALPPEMRFGDVGETDKGVFIQSMDGAKLSVTAFGAEFSSSDTYQLLPCVYLPSNYEYYAISVAKEIRVLIEEGEEFILPPSGNSAIVFIASGEMTTVTITPSQDVEIIKGTTTPAGTSLEQTLGKGKAVFLSSPEDLTGTRVVSDKPLAFFSGHECGTMPFDLQFCDHMVEQILPTSTWGTEFYTASFMTRSLDRFRALTSRDDNSIRWVCTGENPTSDERSLPTAGNFTEFEIPSNRFCRFTSIYPALLAQFSIGGATSSLFAADPSMTIVPPAGQYKDSYMLNYFSGQIVTNFVNIFLLATPGITTDGVSLDKAPISGTWSGISCEEGNEVCAYGIQVEITGTESGVVTLAHSNPDAKLLGISYSTDIRTSRASHSGMTQKPIALDTVSLSASEYSVEEGSGEVVISISRTGDLLDDITVLFAAGEIPRATSAAIAGEDFTEARRAVLLPAGMTSVTQTVALGPDNIFPGEAKVFEVYLGPAPGAFVSPTALANVTITDSDPPLPVMNITLSQTSYAISESSGYFEIILMKTDGARGPVTVSVTPINGTALASTDFELNQMDITFRISEREKVVPVRIINDDIAERSERFTVMIQPVEGLFRVAVLDNLTTVDIIDDDRMLMAFMPSVESPENESVGGVTESVGMIYVDLVVVKGAIDRNVTVLLMANPQDGDTAFEGEDYEVIERGLTIHPTTTRITVGVDIIDDSTCEDKEVFSLSTSLQSSDDPISIVNDIRITIADADDCLPVVRMTVEPTVVSEAGEIVEVTVSLAGGGGNLPGEVQLGISTVPIQPKDIDSVGVEILTQSEVTLTFEEGSSSRQLQIGVRDNSVYDGGEDRIFAIILSLLYTDFENLNISSDYVEVRITDDEPQPEGIVCNVRGEPRDAPTAEVCCVDLGGMSYEKSIYTIPCIGKLVI
ncbi:Adhesion G-protein coupled receptor V1, partial [Geodia barretti]